MSFSSLPSGLVDFLANSAPNIAGSPRVIEPQDDAPVTRPRRAMPPQLDVSNLAGPVPTELSGDSAPFDYTKALSPSQSLGGPYADQPAYNQLDRSNLAGAVPTNLSGGPSAAPMPAPDIPMRSNVGADAMGVPTNIPGMQKPPIGYANLPSQVQTPINRTWNGTVAPNISDSKYQDMGRGASAKAAFLQGLSHGGLIGGGLNALIGVLDKGYGRQAQYNTDTQRWFNTKDAQLKAEEADPLIRSRIQEAQFEQEQPLRLQQYQAQNTIATQNKNLLQDNKYDRLENLQDIKDTNALERVQARLDSNEDLKSQAIEAAQNKNLNATALAVAAANGRTTVTPVDRQIAGKMIQQFDQSKTDKNIAQTDTAKAQKGALESLKSLRDKQGNLVQDKLDNPDKYFGGRGKDLTPNARYNAEIGTYDDAIKHIDRQIGQLEAGKRSGFPDDNYDSKKAALANDRAALVTKKEARKAELLANPPGRGSQQSGKVVSSDELKSYADANFGGDVSKAKEAYLHHARQRGITVTFQ